MLSVIKRCLTNQKAVEHEPVAGGDEAALAVWGVDQGPEQDILCTTFVPLAAETLVHDPSQ
jgi:hypothetical protein